jgi:predicted ATPase/class 3 adenylate cyclase
MGALPTGTVTFLFTDLEVSTRLWDEEPDAMREALARHDAILRDAIALRGGSVVKGTGDGVHAAFVTADDAVRAAVDGQLALQGEPWDVSEPLRVRMGIHAGVAELRAGDYFGPEVNRAARVMAVAHGGQIVCTRVVEELVRDRFELLDLGEHRLRDLHSSVQLFQVEVPGVPGRFPPLRSLDAYRSNLPYESSSFIGREHELDAVAALLAESRVVSIVGVGGVGKTRLALQVGSELLPSYADGVWLCELASVLDPADLHDAVAAALGYTPPQGVSVVEGLGRFFEHKSLLLILDNCEHLVRAVSSFVTDTTVHAPGVSVLATSREALGVPGEHLSPLAPLALPADSDPESVLASESGALFVARAREAGGLVIDEPNAASVRDLCLRLDGIPLALELAAAQTAVMSPTEIGSRLDRQFRLLTGRRNNVLERHQTLRAAIDWSYELLTGEERALLDWLSVCVGGFDLDAVAAIAAGIGADEFEAYELLGSLVAKSLVERAERDGVTRYRVLEMIRQYAAEHLDSAEAAGDARDHHARHYLALAGSLFHDARGEHDYEALERLDTETPNIASAARWLLDNERFVELAEFFADLPIVDTFALPTTTLDELAAVADHLLDQPTLEMGRGISTAWWIASCRNFVHGDAARHRHLAELTTGIPDLPIDAMNKASQAMFDGDLASAASHAARAAELARRDHDPIELAITLSVHATMASPLPGAPASTAALAIAEEALAVARRTPSHIARLFPLAAVTWTAQQLDPTLALTAAEELLRSDTTQRRWWSGVVRSGLAELHHQTGDHAQALHEWRQLIQRAHDNGERFLVSTQIAHLADTVAPTNPSTAIDLAAIAESDAIAPIATFTIGPQLLQLSDDHTPAITAARQRARLMTYDEAIEYALAAVDQLITELEPSTERRAPNEPDRESEQT